MKKKNDGFILNYIGKYAIQKDMTFDEISRAASVDRTSLYRWKMGLSAPNVVAAIRIARVLGRSVEEIWPAN